MRENKRFVLSSEMKYFVTFILLAAVAGKLLSNVGLPLGENDVTISTVTSDRQQYEDDGVSFHAEQSVSVWSISPYLRESILTFLELKSALLSHLRILVARVTRHHSLLV